jgi:hypothetical protein
VHVVERVHLSLRGGFSIFCRCHFRAQKSLDYQGPPPMALVMDVARIKIITSRAILTQQSVIGSTYAIAMNTLNYEEQRRRVIYLCLILFV